MRAQHRGGRFRPDRAVLILHLPPLFALALRRARDRVERDFVHFGNARRPQPDESVPAGGQDIFPVLARRDVRDGRVVQMQRRERRGCRSGSVEGYARDLRCAVVRGGHDAQILIRRACWL